MKNVLKISLAALTFSLIMLLSPTQINASYISQDKDICQNEGSTCTCTNGCKVTKDGCKCYRKIKIPFI